MNIEEHDNGTITIENTAFLVVSPPEELHGKFALSACVNLNALASLEKAQRELEGVTVKLLGGQAKDMRIARLEAVPSIKGIKVHIHFKDALHLGTIQIQ